MCSAAHKETNAPFYITLKLLCHEPWSALKDIRSNVAHKMHWRFIFNNISVLKQFLQLATQTSMMQNPANTKFC